MSQKNCATCGKQCRGNQCQPCYKSNRALSQGRNVAAAVRIGFDLQDVISSHSVNLNESGLHANGNGTLFSNPSFRGGSLVDVEYVATADSNMDSSDEVPTEKFSLIQLITTIVLRQIGDLESANKTLKTELDALKAENTVAASASGSIDLETKLAPINEAVKKLAPIEKTIQNHQRYLDQVDLQKRETNIIITGLKEEATANDNQRVNDILAVVECSTVKPVKVMRIGKKNEDSERSRPLLVVTDSITSKKKILSNKSKLKSGREDLKSVYIKADEPLCVRNEWKRLKEVLKNEKNAPTNVACNVKIDYKR